MLRQVFLAAENWKQLPPAEEAVRIRKARTPPHHPDIMDSWHVSCELQVGLQAFVVLQLSNGHNAFSWPFAQPGCASLHVHDAQPWKQALRASLKAGSAVSMTNCGSQRWAL